MRSGTVSPLDPEALDRLRRTMGTEAEFHSMLQEFLSASKRLMGDLHAACREGRRADAERAVHTMKSMARMVGASDLATTAATVEAAAADALPEAPAVASLGAHLAAAHEAVTRCLE